MLSKEQAQALTRLVHLLRPAWNEEGVYAALGKVRDRDPFDVALASLRAAADEKAKTPGVIPSPGPHWNELESKLPLEPRLTREERRRYTCAHCGALKVCKPPAHEFLPLDQAAGGRTQAAHLARAELAQTRANLCSHGVPVAVCHDHRTDDSKGGYVPDPEGADQPEPPPCGHAEMTRGCGGCDPGAIDFVITDDGVRRPFDPARDMTVACRDHHAAATDQPDRETPDA